MTQTAEEVKALPTDNEGENISHEFKTYLLQHVIQYQLTVACTPQQNGVAERTNRTIMNCARLLLHRAKLDKKCALATAVYIRNRVFSQYLLKDVTPIIDGSENHPTFHTSESSVLSAGT